MSRTDVADIFASIRLFRGADRGFFERLAQQPRARLATTANEQIYEAGDPADALFVAFPRDAASSPRSVVELSLPTSDTGAQSHVEHIVAGDVFGEFEFVAAGLGAARAVRRSSARAVVDVELYRIPYPLLSPLLAEVEQVRARLIKLSFDRLVTALNVKSTHLLGDRDVAFANWLLDTTENLGIAEGRHVRFTRTIGQREIAEALGVTRETMSLRLNEWERAGLLNTGGQSQRLEILDYPRVALRAGVQKRSPQPTINAALAEVDADLARGDLVRARNIALDMLMFFPASPELRHRVALATIRAGNIRDALAGLAHGGYATGGDIDLLRTRVRMGLGRAHVAPDRLFFGAGEEAAAEDAEWEEPEDADERLPILVEDLAAIEARAQKELAFAAADPETRRERALVSADTYESIYVAVGGIYAGINAAMMAGLAGDAARRSRLAKEIIRQIGNRPTGYWAPATLGEARLLLGETEAAGAAFAAANTEPDATDGHRSSTRLQISRIGADLGIATDTLLEALPVGSTAVYAGPLFRGKLLDDEAQADLEAVVRAGTETVLAEENVRHAYGALACGADIVMAEAALAAGAELHVVLPYPVEEFETSSVEIGSSSDAPHRWVERFRDCLRQSASLTTLVERPPEGRHLDAFYFHAFKLAAGLALIRAETLSARAVMIAVDDGRERGSIAGTAVAAGDWAAAGLPLRIIPLAMDNAKTSTAAGVKDPFRPVIFLWPVNEALDLEPVIAAAAKATGLALTGLPRPSRDRRTGLAVPLETLDDALRVLEAFAAGTARVPEAVRVIADFGPATDGKGEISDGLISRMPGASDMVGLPPGQIIATRTFAARSKAESGNAASFVPIGRTWSPDRRSDGRPLPSREVYSVSFGARTVRKARR